MKELLIEGKYATAKVFTVDNEKDAIDQHARAQIKMICDDEVSKDAIIRVMPDVHAGKVGPIGLTMKLNHTRIIPNLLGNDLGCGVTIFKIDPGKKLTASDFNKLDKVIRDNIPVNLYKGPRDPYGVGVIKDLRFNTPMNIDRLSLCYGTLGNGNHFIEIDMDENGQYYLTIHTGSRSIGPAINDYFNKKGQEELKARGISVPYEMTYIDDMLYVQYVDDVRKATEFARLNRNRIRSIICRKMKWDSKIEFNAPHNSISEQHLLCKGAACEFESANKLVYIPINMRDGILYGELNFENRPEWNYSLPHGSGRLIKRSEVKNSVTLNMFKKEMDGVFSTSVSKDTLDESPFAYRRIDEIREAVSDIVYVKGALTPVYNFKGGN
jgi:RNA-splicing ligase RtcB